MALERRDAPSSEHQFGNLLERSEADQRAFMKELSDLAYAKQKRVLYTRHQYFIDFEELNWNDGDPPVYINLIRDPIDRFKSFYYFSRYGNKRAQVRLLEGFQFGWLKIQDVFSIFKPSKLKLLLNHFLSITSKTPILGCWKDEKSSSSALNGRIYR